MRAQNTALPSVVIRAAGCPRAELAGQCAGRHGGYFLALYFRHHSLPESVVVLELRGSERDRHVLVNDIAGRGSFKAQDQVPDAPEHFLSRAGSLVPSEPAESLRHVAPPKSRDILSERFPAVKQVHLRPDVRNTLWRRRSGQLYDAAPLEVCEGPEPRRPRVFDRACFIHD